MAPANRSTRAWGFRCQGHSKSRRLPFTWTAACSLRLKATRSSPSSSRFSTTTSSPTTRPGKKTKSAQGAEAAPRRAEPTFFHPLAAQQFAAYHSCDANQACPEHHHGTRFGGRQCPSIADVFLRSVARGCAHRRVQHETSKIARRSVLR